MNAPVCKQHGPMIPRESHTPEQVWCGEWWQCEHCTSAVCDPSPELKAALAKADAP